VNACPGITFADADGRLLARCAAAAAQPLADRDAFGEALQRAGYGGWVLHEEAIAALLLRCAVGEGGFEQAIGERRDACATVEVAADATQAWIDFVPARGGRELLAGDLEQALYAAGVLHGIRHEALEQACASPAPVRVVAAVAMLPTQGADTRFEVLMTDTRDRRPVVDEQGLVDFHELGAIPIVHPGEPLMRRHPPTPGIDGLDVRGALLPALAGRDEAFDAEHAGAAVSDDDPDLLCATIVGQPVRAERSVSVERVLQLPEVSLATGNIRFDGTLEVQGDVRPGMKVEVSGDLIVSGLAEGANLKAGASIRVAGGLIAKSVAQAGQAFSARFVEHSKVVAGTTIAIEDSAVHSDLHSLTDVRIGLNSRQRGRLVGGSTCAMMLVAVPKLGAAAGGLTKVQVGLNPELSARQRTLMALVQQREQEEDRLGKLVRHLKLRPAQRDLLERAQATWEQAQRHLDQAMRELSEVQCQLKLTPHARVEVLSAVEGDVDLMFGLVLRSLRRRCGAGSFLLDDSSRIVHTDAAGAVHITG
jgi:uncharacterized protein (DUF342 family)